MDIPKEFRWTTQDGRVLDIRWMDSIHLVHSFNMIARKTNLRVDAAMSVRGAITAELITMIAIRDEIKARQLMLFTAAKQPAQIVVPNAREDFKTLCMLRAILDVRPKLKNLEEIVEHFKDAPGRYIEHVVSCADPKWVPVVAKFAEYRLARTA